MKKITKLFQGRINRIQWVKLNLIILVIFSAFGVVQTWLLQIILKDNIVVLSVVLALGLLAWPFVIILGASVNVRRLHDIGHSGWILLLALVPFLNIIIYIYLAVKPGILLTNKYGELATQNKLLKLLIND